MKLSLFNNKSIICKSVFTKKSGLQIVLFAIIYLMISSCECVPDINTPKIISPEEYSEAMLINCSNINSISVYSDEIEVIENLEKNLSDLKFYKFWSGERFIKVKNTQTKNTVLNFPVSFKEKQFYTIAFYSIESKLKYLVSGDSINSLKFNNFSYFKIINVVDNNPRITLQISENTVNKYNFSNLNNYISEYYPINYGNYTIKIINPIDSKILIEKNVKIELNSAHNLIISGNISTNSIDAKVVKLNSNNLN